MRTEITYSPAFAMATVHLEPGEAVHAEAGAMMAMTPTVDISTSTSGGILKGLRRSVLGGESFFMNSFSAKGSGGHVVFAAALPGDVITWPLAGNMVYLQSGAFLAAAEDIEVDSKWGGSRTFFSKEGLFMLKCSGHGDLVVAGYGAIHEMDLEQGESYVVDTGHLVGWEAGVDYKVRKAGSWKSTVFGAEGLVVHLTGPGRVLLQTRSPQDFLGWLVPQLPGERS